MKKEVAILLVFTLLIAGCGGTDSVEVIDRAPGKKSPAKAKPKQDTKESQSKGQPEEPTKTSPTDKTTTAKMQLQQIAAALNRYQIDMRSYPDVSLGLAVLRKAPEEISYGSKWLGPYLEKDLPLDPWDSHYQYERSFDEYSQPVFLIWSNGPNKKAEYGGDDISEHSTGHWLIFTTEKKAAAQIHLRALANALELYHTDLGTYPAKEIGLQALKLTPSLKLDEAALTHTWAGPYFRKDLPLDPWDHDYFYDVKPDKNDKETFSLWSVGADGKNGTADDIIQEPIPGYAETLAAALTKGDSKELLALGVTPNYLFGQISLGALKQLQEFRKALNLYQLDMKSYPNTTAGLGALLKQPKGVEGSAWKGPYLKEPLPLDPWGNKYFYELKTDANKGPSFRIWSIGRNFQNDGESGDDIVVRSDGEIPKTAQQAGSSSKEPAVGSDSPATAQDGESVDLSYSELTVEKLADLKEVKDLRDLKLNKTQISDDGLEQIKQLATLESLGLANTQVTDAGLAHLKELKALRALDLSYTQVTDAGLPHLQGLTNLQILDLPLTKVTDAGLEQLKGMTSLVLIDIRLTKVTDAGLAHLTGLENLKSLNLAANQVTDAGLAHLKTLAALTVLDLGYTQVTDAGLAHLEGLTNLQSLNLKRTQVTDEAVAQLQESLKDCRITTNKTVAAAAEAAQQAAAKTAETEKAEPKKTTETKEQPTNSPTSTAGLSRVAKYAITQIKKYDTNNDGTLDKAEWSENKFIKDSFDANGDGKITVEELTKGFGG